MFSAFGSQEVAGCLSVIPGREAAAVRAHWTGWRGHAGRWPRWPTREERLGEAPWGQEGTGLREGFSHSEGISAGY